MQFQFSFKHMESSDAVTGYAKEKLKAEIQKFVNKPVDCHLTFSVDKHKHTAHCSFNGGDGFMFQVEHTCTDMYGSIDHMVDKLEVQLRRQKEKIKDHKNRKSPKKVGFNGKDRDFEAAEIDAEDILKYEQARRRIAG
ncbi:MAG: ribosome-associated translation inhibitor RaiA [Proteobacteria bacterium]|nr:ribosome-associated translation inhibitor RaiA [Pseudomonadota bacterium]